MISKLFTAFSLGLTAAAAAANDGATTTISIPWMGYTEDQLSAMSGLFEGSIVSANPTATTVSMACADQAECGVFPRETIVFGPSTYNMDMSDPSPDADFTGTMDCVVGKTAVCVESASGTEANFPGSSTVTYEATLVGTSGLRITAGVEKLNVKADATTEAEASATASTHPDGSRSESLSASTGSVTPSGAASQTGSAAAPDSTGAANGNAVVGGGLLSIAAGVLGGLLL
ncbi:hypothetical protein DDE82_005203 [Stemphylium lycopersici]|nr:hypothetical protein TW65_03283 [Stemphylium lycopersici]RAR03362.1 hypothetical protein DDE82_005203 [Stemphylium lycopersici]